MMATITTNIVAIGTPTLPHSSTILRCPPCEVPFRVSPECLQEDTPYYWSETSRDRKGETAREVKTLLAPVKVPHLGDDYPRGNMYKGVSITQERAVELVPDTKKQSIPSRVIHP